MYASDYDISNRINQNMQNTIKNINKLLASLPQVTATYGRRTSDDEEVTSLCADSRAVEPGAMFVAVRGVTSTDTASYPRQWPQAPLP